MSFQYTLIYCILCVELFVLFALLLVPEFIRIKLCNLIQRTTNQMFYIFVTTFVLIGVPFIDSFKKILNDNHHHAQPQMINGIFDPYSHCKLFYAQRNLYLTGITLVLGFVLFRLPRIVTINKNNHIG